MLQKSFEVLVAGRKSLMMSHIFAYFVIESNQKNIFEENQKDLANAVDVLSNYLEEDYIFEKSYIKIKDQTE